MDYNEIWRSKEVKNVMVKILHPNDDDTITVTFDMNSMTPRSTHRYQRWYLEQYYEPTGQFQVWKLDERLAKV